MLAATFIVADNICKQLGTRSGLTKCQSWSWSKQFGTLVVFLKEFFKKKIILKKKSADDNKSMEKFSACKELNKEIGTDSEAFVNAEKIQNVHDFCFDSRLVWGC